MKTEDLIEKYISGSISDNELNELRLLLKKDREALRMLMEELQFSELMGEYFHPERRLDIISLLTEQINGELDDEDLNKYAAAKGKSPEEYLAEMLKNKRDDTSK